MYIKLFVIDAGNLLCTKFNDMNIDISEKKQTFLPSSLK